MRINKRFVYISIILAVICIGIFIISNWEGLKSKPAIQSGTDLQSDTNQIDSNYKSMYNINPDDYNPMEFLEMLKEKPGEPVEANTAKAGWVTREDVFKLLKMTGSSEPCSPVWHNHLISSYLPPEKTSTIGNEAEYMLDSFVEGRYPSRFYSNSGKQPGGQTDALFDKNATGNSDNNSEYASKYNKDYESWWQELEAGLQQYSSSVKLVLLYNKIKESKDLDALQLALLKDAAFEYLPDINEVYDSNRINPVIEKKAPSITELVSWAYECASTSSKAMYNFLRIATRQMSDGLRKEYLECLDNLLRKNDFSFFKQLEEIEKHEDVSKIIQLTATLFIKDRSLIKYLDGRFGNDETESGELFDRIMMAYNQMLQIEPDLQQKENRAFEERYFLTDFYTKQKILPLYYDIQSNICVGYKIISENINEKKGTVSLVGIPEGTTEIYICNLNTNKSVPLGRMNVIVNSCLSYDRKYFAINDSSNVAVINLQNSTMNTIHSDGKTGPGSIYNTNWSKDSSCLYIHMDEDSCYYAYDVKACKLLSQRGSFQPGEEIFRGYTKSSELYSKEKRFGVINSLYRTYPEKFEMIDEQKPNVIHDIYGDWLLMTVEYMGAGSGTDYVFKRYNVLTGEDHPIEYFNTYKAPYNIYKACFLKGTGEIIFTRIVPEDLGYRYELVKLSPSLEVAHIQRVSSPMFTLSPGETELYFATGKGHYNPGIIVNVESFDVVHMPAEPGTKGYSKSFAEFLITMERAYLFYTGHNRNYPDEIFTNTYDPVPQEALENVMRDQSDRFIRNLQLKYYTYDNETRMHADLDLYFHSAHELVQEGSGIWKITGLSTYPSSSERVNVLNKVISGLGFSRDKTKGTIEKDCDAVFSEFAGQYAEIGEIELWATSEPHRAPNPDHVNLAKVKIKVSNGDGLYKKYIVNLSRTGNDGAWKIGYLKSL